MVLPRLVERGFRDFFAFFPLYAYWPIEGRDTLGFQIFRLMMVLFILGVTYLYLYENWLFATPLGFLTWLDDSVQFYAKEKIRSTFVGL